MIVKLGTDKSLWDVTIRQTSNIAWLGSRLVCWARRAQCISSWALPFCVLPEQHKTTQLETDIYCEEGRKMHRGISGAALPILLFLLKRPDSTTSPIILSLFSRLNCVLPLLDEMWDTHESIQFFLFFLHFVFFMNVRTRHNIKQLTNLFHS